LFPDCTHFSKQICSAPKTVEDFIKLKAGKAMFPMMKKIDELMDCQKVDHKILFVKERIWGIRARK